MVLVTVNRRVIQWITRRFWLNRRVILHLHDGYLKPTCNPPVFIIPTSSALFILQNYSAAAKNITEACETTSFATTYKPLNQHSL